MMTIEEILAAFESVPKQQFPTEAINAAIAQQEAITPFLLKILDITPEELDAKEYAESDETQTSFTFIFALYLLGQFREQQALPLILRFFSTPGEAVSDVSGDIITEDLKSLLAATYNGDFSALAAVVTDTQVNPYVRHAVIEAMLILDAEHQLEEGALVAYLENLFDTYPRDPEDYQFWSPLISDVARLRVDSLRGRIDQAFDDDLIDTFFIRRDDVDKIYAGEYYPRESSSQVDVMDIASWVWFQEERHYKPLLPQEPVDENAVSSSSRRSTYLPLPPVKTVKRETPKVGRNDPCPCGSGKKYKKCCGK